MPDNNYHTIKPVEGLQNLAGLKPVSRRQSRKQRKYQQSENNTGEQTAEQNSQQQHTPANNGSQQRLDFKA